MRSLGGKKRKIKPFPDRQSKEYRRVIKWRKVASLQETSMEPAKKIRLTMQEGDPAGGSKGQLTVRSEGNDTNMYLVSIFH